MKDTAYQWGPLAVNGSLLMMILAVVVFYLGLRLWLRGQGEVANQIYEWTWNAGVGAILVWKFGEWVMQPSLLAKGLSALMMPGSQRSGWLAVGWITLYFIWTWRKSKPLVIIKALDAWTFAGVMSMAVYSASSFELGSAASTLVGWVPAGLEGRYHPLFLYKAIAGLLLAVILYRRGRHKIGYVFGWGVAAAGMMYMVTSFFEADRARLSVFAGLSSAQWLNTIMMVSGLVWIWIALPALTHTRAGKEMMVMANNRSNDSKAQQEHARENKQQREGTLGVDKKLSGPNRPAE